MKIAQNRSIYMEKNLTRSEKYSAKDGIQKQIQQTQEEMQKLSENEKLDAKDKMKMQKKLEEQLAELNKQLVEKQMEEKKAEMKERAEKIHESAENMNKSQSTEEEVQCGLSKSSMQAIVSASSSMEQAKAINRVRTSMNGDSHVLKGQIAVEEAKGNNPLKLKEQLVSLEKRIGEVTSGMLEKYGNAVDYMNKAVEEEKETNGKISKEVENGEEKEEIGQPYKIENQI